MMPSIKFFFIFSICCFLSLFVESSEISGRDSVEAKVKLFEHLSENQLNTKYKSGNPYDKIAASYLIGKILFNHNAFEQSFYVFNSILKDYPKLLSKKFEYKLKVNCGLALCENKQFERSLNYLKSADLSILHDKNKEEQALLSLDIGNTYYEWGKLDTASIYYQKAEFLFKEAGKEKPLAELYNKLGALAHFYHLSDVAISYYQKSKIIAEKFGVKLEYANSLVNLGMAYMEQKKFDDAAKILRDALKYAQTLKYSEGEVCALNSIATLFALKNDNAMALEFLQKSDSIVVKSKDIKLKMLVLNNMGTLYKLMKKFDKALQYFEELRKLQLANAINPANTELSLAEIYKLQNNLNKCMDYLALSQQKFLDLRNKFGYYSAEFQLAEVYLKLKEISKAEIILIHLLEKIKKENSEKYSELESGVYLRLSELYGNQNNTQKALSNYKAYEKLKMISFEKSYTFELAKIQNDSKLLKLDAEIKVLSLQNEAKTSEIYYQRRKSYFFLFSSLVFIGLSIFLLKLNFDKKKLNAALVKRNLELVKQIPFQEFKETWNETSDTEIDKSKEIIKKLIELFENEQVYLLQDLNLSQIATRLNTNRTYLSKAIHDILDTNFNLFVNMYRITYARKMLSDPQQKLSIEGIAQSAGFSSKSTFNNAFKSFTGLTPSYLRSKVLEVI